MRMLWPKLEVPIVELSPSTPVQNQARGAIFATQMHDQALGVRFARGSGPVQSTSLSRALRLAAVGALGVLQQGFELGGFDGFGEELKAELARLQLDVSFADSAN